MPEIWKCRNQSLPIGKKTLIMGILNVTPDSFSDGGKYNTLDLARKRITIMLDEGADIIDIGGESSRPFADPVPEDEELRRVIPIIDEFSENVIISIDTYKPNVAREAILKGASIINDITGFKSDDMIKIVSKFEAGAVIMHMLGNPRNMQKNPRYNNLIQEITDYLFKQASKLIQMNFSKECIAIDPGIGFGKTTNDNFEIIRNLSKFQTLGFPILLGASRKSFMKAVGLHDTSDRLEGSIAAAVAGILSGAAILRVHDVKETKRAALIADAIKDKSNFSK